MNPSSSAQIGMRLGKIIDIDDSSYTQDDHYHLVLNFKGLGEYPTSIFMPHHTKDELIGCHVICIVSISQYNTPCYECEILTAGLPNAEMYLGKIIKVERFPYTESPPYRVCVDLGKGRLYWTYVPNKSYSKNELFRRHVVCATNIQPPNFAGLENEILIIGGGDTLGEINLLQPEGSAVLGSKVF